MILPLLDDLPSVCVPNPFCTTFDPDSCHFRGRASPLLGNFWQGRASQEAFIHLYRAKPKQNRGGATFLAVSIFLVMPFCENGDKIR
jgi:hypothetical protein